MRSKQPSAVRQEPLAPTWHTWTLVSGDEFRPAAPPAIGSPGYESQLSAVPAAVDRRTVAQVLTLTGIAIADAEIACWAGIHFPIDNDAGQFLGRNVGYLITEVARQDGTE